MNHPPDEDLDAWTYSLLAPTEAHALERHVAQCTPCEARLREAARLSALLDEAAPAPPRSLFTPRRVLALASAAALALLLWPREEPPAVREERRAAPAESPLRLHARELQSLGRVVRYEALPDPAWQPDDPS